MNQANGEGHAYREEFFSSVNRAMATQPVWADMSEAFKSRLLSALYTAGYGFDDCVNFCDELGDEIREVIQSMSQEEPKKRR